MLNKALLGIICALLFLFIQATINTLNTKAKYTFSNHVINETLQIEFDDGLATMVLNKKNDKKLCSSIFKGFYLRFQNRYYLFGVNHIEHKYSHLMFINYFIDTLHSEHSLFILNSSNVDNYSANILLGEKLS